MLLNRKLATYQFSFNTIHIRYFLFGDRSKVISQVLPSAIASFFIQGSQWIKLAASNSCYSLWLVALIKTMFPLFLLDSVEAFRLTFHYLTSLSQYSLILSKKGTRSSLQCLHFNGYLLHQWSRKLRTPLIGIQRL